MTMDEERQKGCQVSALGSCCGLCWIISDPILADPLSARLPPQVIVAVRETAPRRLGKRPFCPTFQIGWHEPSLAWVGRHATCAMNMSREGDLISFIPGGA